MPSLPCKELRPAEFQLCWPSCYGQYYKKEQLPALHGTNKQDGKKWFAWHGLGENQLHFGGEGNWWPKEKSPHQVSFDLPTTDEKISVERFIDLLASLQTPA